MEEQQCTQASPGRGALQQLMPTTQGFWKILRIATNQHLRDDWSWPSVRVLSRAVVLG
jgi:hypothetical protein